MVKRFNKLILAFICYMLFSLVSLENSPRFPISDLSANTSTINKMSYSDAPEISWNTTFGGFDHEFGASVIHCSTGGYALAGTTTSYGLGGPTYDADIWLVRTDENGHLLWNQTYGGVGDDQMWDWDMVIVGGELIECSTGGFAIVGRTNSYGAGARDMWLIRIDSDGNVLWNNTFGGSSSERGCAVVECQDGGFALAGQANSDAWLVKTYPNGTLHWSQTYGESGITEIGEDLVECEDGGFAISGYALDYLPEVQLDMLLIRTDSNGNVVWEETYGGDGDDHGKSLVECEDGGFAIAGHTTSSGEGSYDFWLIRTDADGNQSWERTYGGSEVDKGWSLVETDEGFGLAGFSSSFGSLDFDVWVIETDSNGNKIWDEHYDGGDQDRGVSLVECDDHGFAIGGMTESYGAGENDFWLIRTEEQETTTPTTPTTPTEPTIPDIPGFPTNALVIGLFLAILFVFLIKRNRPE